jgi:hypothetical protein
MSTNAIDSVLNELRVFEPPDEFRAGARITSRRQRFVSSMQDAVASSALVGTCPDSGEGVQCGRDWWRDAGGADSWDLAPIAFSTCGWRSQHAALCGGPAWKQVWGA